VRYELNSYIPFRTNSVFKGLIIPLFSIQIADSFLSIISCSTDPDMLHFKDITSKFRPAAMFIVVGSFVK
jgi:hypothetical protein